MKNVCIVTPEVFEPVNSGDAGTHCFFLARELVENGFAVTVLCTGPLEATDAAFWKKRYHKHGIICVHIDDIETKEPPTTHERFLGDSLKVREFLEKGDFRFIHFHDRQANGFHTIQAKKTTDGFSRSVITVTMHSPAQWQNQGMRRWNKYPFSETKQEWCERYCVRNADILISPSRYMFNWAVENGWRLADDRRVIPYCYRGDPGKGDGAPAVRHVDPSHLIFFGRLETRTGLDYFCNELLLTIEAEPSAIKRVSFVGEIGSAGRGSADEYISEVLGGRVRYRIYPDFDTLHAIEFIMRTGGIVVIPSRLEHFPYAVIECIENGIPVLGSIVSGIPEMLNESALFDVRSKGALRDRILSRELPPTASGDHHYSGSAARHGWLSIHDTPVQDLPESPDYGNPLVSICIAYYNHGRYLPQLFRSIKNLDYSHYQVIAVNDGSTDNASNEVFDSLEKEYSSPNWVYYRKENTGVAHTRNFAVSKADGQYVLFMDADNVANRNMVGDFLTALKKTGADCATCHYYVFRGDPYIEGATEASDRYMPIGPALEIGMLDNVFGDANFIVRKDVFNDVGGFNEDRDASWEDYDFLARLSLKGYTQEVVPRPLFWYRLTPTSLSTQADIHRNRRRILDSYRDSLPPYTRFMLESLLTPYYYGFLVPETNKYPVPEIVQRFIYSIYTHIMRVLGKRVLIRRIIRYIMRLVINLTATTA